MISGYPDGSNITIMDATYHYAKKDESTGKYSDDTMTIIFKDNETGKKGHRVLHKPEYTYYTVNQQHETDYSQFFVDKDKTTPVTCKFTDLDKSVAEQTGQLDLYYDNIKSGNRRANKLLHTHPKLLGSDLNINNYYRKEFAKKYTNDITPITKSYLDIEADIKYMAGDFPEPGECPINAVSIYVDNTGTLYTFILRDSRNPLIAEFEKYLSRNDFHKEYMEFLEYALKGWKNVHRMKLQNLKTEQIFFDDELEMLANLFRAINILQPDFVLAWNMAFDMPYIIQRIINLGADPAEIICHPDFSKKYCTYFVDEQHRSIPEQRGDFADISSYSIYLDQLIQFASRRKGQSAFDSFKLDDIGAAIAKVRKLDYKHITTDLAELPYIDFKTFIMYNMTDVIVQYCIEEKVEDINYVFSKAITNATQYAKVHRQTVYLANRAVSTFLKNNDAIAGNNCNKFNEKPTEKFAGAFVADPNKVSYKAKAIVGGNPVMLYKNANDFDYKRLYPSLTQEFNMAPNTQIGMIEIPNKVHEFENRSHQEKFSRAGAFIEDLASKNYLDFGHRWLHLGNYEEVFSDIVEYWTTKKTPFNGCLDLKLSQGIMDIVYRVHDDQPIQIVQRRDVEQPIRVVDRYVSMPTEVQNEFSQIIEGIEL